MSDVFDLDALAAEANDTPFQFRFGGDVYTCANDPSVELVKALEDGDLVAALEMLVGPDQWQRLKASPRQFGVKAYGQVLTKYAEHLGLTVPNSSPSTVSS